VRDSCGHPFKGAYKKRAGPTKMGPPHVIRT
jgi:hypothetical protein